MKVVLDIETVQAPKEEWARLAGVDVAAAENLLEASEAAQQDKDYDRSSFDGTFSRIVCIGMIAFTDSMEPRAPWPGTAVRKKSCFGSSGRGWGTPDRVSS